MDRPFLIFKKSFLNYRMARDWQFSSCYGLDVNTLENIFHNIVVSCCCCYCWESDSLTKLVIIFPAVVTSSQPFLDNVLWENKAALCLTFKNKKVTYTIDSVSSFQRLANFLSGQTNWDSLIVGTRYQLVSLESCRTFWRILFLKTIFELYHHII